MLPRRNADTPVRSDTGMVRRAPFCRKHCGQECPRYAPDRPCPTFNRTQTGATALIADQVKLWNGRAWDIYYHNGTAWRLNGSAENQNATVVFPDEGMFLVHRKSRSMKPFFAGVVPTTVQKTELPSPATRFAANRFPVKMTLLSSGIAALPGWRASRNVSQGCD